MPKPRCTATTKAGKRCHSWAKYGDRCVMHASTPEAEAERDLMRRRGMRKMRRTNRYRKAQREAQANLQYPAKPQTIADAKGYLAWIADNALRGLLDSTAARTATATIREWIAAEGYTAKIRDLTKRIEQLQQADATKKKGRR
jgi:hypothetical protein